MTAAVTDRVDHRRLRRPECIACEIVNLDSPAGGPAGLRRAIEDILAANCTVDLLRRQPGELRRCGAAAEFPERRRLQSVLFGCRQARALAFGREKGDQFGELGTP